MDLTDGVGDPLCEWRGVMEINGWAENGLLTVNCISDRQAHITFPISDYQLHITLFTPYNTTNSISDCQTP